MTKLVLTFLLAIVTGAPAYANLPSKSERIRAAVEAVKAEVTWLTKMELWALRDGDAVAAYVDALVNDDTPTAAGMAMVDVVAGFAIGSTGPSRFRPPEIGIMAAPGQEQRYADGVNAPLEASPNLDRIAGMALVDLAGRDNVRESLRLLAIKGLGELFWTNEDSDGAQGFVAMAIADGSRDRMQRAAREALIERVSDVRRLEAYGTHEVELIRETANREMKRLRRLDRDMTYVEIAYVEKWRLKHLEYKQNRLERTQEIVRTFHKNKKRERRHEKALAALLEDVTQARSEVNAARRMRPAAVVDLQLTAYYTAVVRLHEARVALGQYANAEEAARALPTIDVAVESVTVHMHAGQVVSEEKTGEAEFSVDLAALGSWMMASSAIEHLARADEAEKAANRSAWFLKRLEPETLEKAKVRVAEALAKAERREERKNRVQRRK